jgi:phage-related protein
VSDFVNGWCPTPSLPFNSAWRMNIAQFGDGYEQRELDGINALNRSWTVEYATRPQSEILAMDLYLVAQKARSFGFRDPVTGLVHDVTCDSWDINWNIVQWDATGKRTVFGTLSAEFRRTNGASTLRSGPAPTNASRPGIIPSADGLTLTYRPGYWNGALYVGFEWLVDGEPSGLSNASLFVGDLDGRLVSVRETVVNLTGTAVAASDPYVVEIGNNALEVS